MPEPASATSIHYRRRWFYALWTSLLALSCVALFFWERPARTERASLQVILHVKGAPAGVRVQGWAGPRGRWQGEAWQGDGAFGDLPLMPDGAVTLPVVRLAIARRRWNLGTIPRGTWDLVMVKLTPPQGPPRYLAVPCAQDIRTGLLRPRFRLTQTIDVSWMNLGVDAKPAIRIP